MKNPAISRTAAEMWREAPEPLKQRYKHLADLRRWEHRIKYPNYKYKPQRKPKVAPRSEPSTADSGESSFGPDSHLEWSGDALIPLETTPDCPGYDPTFYSDCLDPANNASLFSTWMMEPWRCELRCQTCSAPLTVSPEILAAGPYNTSIDAGLHPSYQH